MRHKCGYKALGRPNYHRQALLRNLATSFLRRGHCETTLARAKALRPIVEKLISLGKEDSLHARRQAYGFIYDKQVVHRLFVDLGPQYRARPGGYTRIVKLPYRRNGDAAEVAVLQLVE
jgi:large subunit ribosomal protein L17